MPGSNLLDFIFCKLLRWHKYLAVECKNMNTYQFIDNKEKQRILSLPDKDRPEPDRRYTLVTFRCMSCWQITQEEFKEYLKLEDLNPILDELKK